MEYVFIVSSIMDFEGAEVEGVFKTESEAQKTQDHLVLNEHYDAVVISKHLLRK